MSGRSDEFKTTRKRVPKTGDMLLRELTPRSWGHRNSNVVADDVVVIVVVALENQFTILFSEMASSSIAG